MVDMTKGGTLRHLCHFAVPVVLGSWLQTAYNTVDSIIAGNFIGENALAAEGIASPVMNLIILFITGLCLGSGILMSEAFGRKDLLSLKETLSSLLIFGLISSSILSVIAFILSPYILKALKCPDEIFSLTNDYLRIIFLGTPFTFLYNALSQGLKSVGDSKTPLLFLAFSSILNAVLDLVFLGVFHFGIICSALTTVVAEIASAGMAFFFMMRREKEIFPERNTFRLKGDILKRILLYGAPTALQSAIQPIGKVFIQGSVNSLGVESIAAFNASSRFDEAACIPEQGIASAISVFIAQNRGAEKHERIRKGFRDGLKLEVLYFVLIGLVTFTLRRAFLSLFVSGEGKVAIISKGAEYLYYMSFFYIFPAFTNGFQGFYRGMGKMYTTAVGTFIQISVRTVFTFLLAPRLDIPAVAFASAIGWTAMLFFEIPYYFITLKKRGLR